MARINLLPWREELRKQKKKDFINAMALSALTGVLIIGVVHGYIETLRSYQEERNKLLEAEIAILDKKIVAINSIEEKKRKLMAKIELIQKLQESRPEIVHLFDEIPKVTPDGVYLKKFVQIGEDLTFEGKSQSNARVSAFMRAIEASQWLNSPVLDVIKTVEKNNPDETSDFILKAKQGNKNKQQSQSQNPTGAGAKP